MTTALAIRAPQDEVEWLTHSLPSLRSDPAIRERAARVVSHLSAPAQQAWTMARIAALLSPYYEKDLPQAVRVMEAQDWAEALSGYPQWAIEGAVRWWKSAENPDRRKRPFEGDIVERCDLEMGGIKAASLYLSLPPVTKTQEPPRVLPSPERRAELVAETQRIMKNLTERMTGGN
jgi:hypothetical protein